MEEEYDDEGNELFQFFMHRMMAVCMMGLKIHPTKFEPIFKQRVGLYDDIITQDNPSQRELELAAGQFTLHAVYAARKGTPFWSPAPIGDLTDPAYRKHRATMIPFALTWLDVAMKSSKEYLEEWFDTH